LARYGGVVLLLAFALSMRSYLPPGNSATSLWGMGGIFVIGVAALLLGVPLLLLCRRGSRDFFDSRVLPRGTAGDLDGAASPVQVSAAGLPMPAPPGPALVANQ